MSEPTEPTDCKCLFCGAEAGVECSKTCFGRAERARDARAEANDE